MTTVHRVQSECDFLHVQNKIGYIKSYTFLILGGYT